MGTLKRAAQGFQETPPSHAKTPEDTKKKAPRGSRLTASGMRYEAAMQELAAEYQRLASANVE